MSEIGERVIVALMDQGFGVVFPTDDEVNILTPNGRRVHALPARYFYGDRPADVTALRIVVAGLELIEGFRAPEGFWP